MPLRRALTSVMHGIGYAFDQLASSAQLRTMAEKWMREIDLELHPWGEPGVVPTEPGEYWCTPRPKQALVACLVTAQGVVQHADGAVVGLPVLWLAPNAQFRRRWTPEGPVTT